MRGGARAPRLCRGALPVGRSTTDASTKRVDMDGISQLGALMKKTPMDAQVQSLMSFETKKVFVFVLMK